MPESSKSPLASRAPSHIARKKEDDRRLGVGNLILGAVLLVAPLLALWRRAMLEVIPWIVGGVALMSFVTFGFYAWDKRQARRGGWRVSEPTLQFLAFFSGWPGAFVAQRLLRHKSSKVSFLAIYWCIVIFHQFVAIDALLDWPMLRALRGWLWELRSQWF